MDKLLDDPEYLPFQAPEPAPLLRHPLFLLAGRQHELDDRPPHVKRQEFLDSEQGTEERGSAKTEFDECIFLEKMVADANFLDQVEQYAFAVTLPTPEIEADWRRAIVKDPSKFVAKKEQQRAAMSEAKQIEISEWVSSKVCQASVGPVPRDRLMKMRWALVFKRTNDPAMVKANARRVVLGFTDSDLGMATVRSPTLTRRVRQCLLQMSLHNELREASETQSSGSVPQGSLRHHGGSSRVLSTCGWNPEATWTTSSSCRSQHLGAREARLVDREDGSSWRCGCPCRLLSTHGRRRCTALELLP